MPKVFLIKKNQTLYSKKKNSESFQRYKQYDSFPYALQISRDNKNQQVFAVYGNNIPNNTHVSRDSYMKLNITYDDSKSNECSEVSPTSVESMPQFNFYSHSSIGQMTCTCCGDHRASSTVRKVNFNGQNDPKKKQMSHVEEKPFICSVCGKGFRLSSTLCRHKIIHTAQRPHKCHVCQKSFNRSSTLKTHLRTHNELKEFACNVCGKGFHQKGNLRNHILIHTGEKPHTCKICMKSFNKLSNLKFHMHSHTDHKPYRCRFCKLSMMRRGELKHHIASNHPNEA